MLVQEVIEQAEIQVQEEYDDATWIDYINQALDDLTPVAKILRTWEMPLAQTVTDGRLEIPFSGEAAALLDAHEVVDVYFKVTDPAEPPHDYTRLPRLLQNDRHSRGWKMITGQITLQNLRKHPLDPTLKIVEVQVRVEYYEKLKHVTAVMEDIFTQTALPSQYHHLLVLFVCAKSQQAEEELTDKNDFYAEYLAGKRSMALDRIWEMEPQHRKRIRDARLVALIGEQRQ